MKTKDAKVIGYPFVEHVDQNLRPSHVFDLNSIFNGSCHSQLDNIKRSGYSKILGYQYNLKPYLKKYVYKQYNSWYEAYAPNKTLLRKSTFGKIDKIIEVI